MDNHYTHWSTVCKTTTPFGIQNYHMLKDNNELYINRKTKIKKIYQQQQ